MAVLAAAAVCLVVGITDVDTLRARCSVDGASQTVVVRLAEIDAPEKRQPFGARARQNLGDLCFGRQASIQPVTQDRYARTVGKVECEGRDAGLAMLDAGLAWRFVRYSHDPARCSPRPVRVRRGEGCGATMTPCHPGSGGQRITDC